MQVHLASDGAVGADGPHHAVRRAEGLLAEALARDRLVGEIDLHLARHCDGSHRLGWDSDEGTDSFVARYQRAYGTAPGVLAATGYHAARRLDVAIRPLDGVIPRAALEDAWRSTESGLPW